MTEVDSRVQEIAHAYKELLRSAGIPVREIWLFGSRARGTAKPWSDLDLGIVSPVFGKNRTEELGQLLVLAARLRAPYPIEPIPFTPEDLDDQWSALSQQVRREGIRIV